MPTASGPGGSLGHGYETVSAVLSHGRVIVCSRGADCDGEPYPISLVVIAYNDEPNMRGCLESVTWADEIIVVDSHSTDATEQISLDLPTRCISTIFTASAGCAMKRYARHP